MTYQDAVKTLRKKMIMSQMEFAEYLGVSFASVNRWERNRFEPTIKAKRKLQPLFEKYKIQDYSKIPKSQVDKKLFVELFNSMNSSIERAIPELFNWQQKKYDTEDLGEVELILDEYTYEILRQRYSELAKEKNDDSDSFEVVYDIKPYLTESSPNSIDKAFLESKYSEFVKDLSNNAPKNQIDTLLSELRSKFAILSVDDQQTADRILQDILSGDLKDFDPNKTFNDYINLYNDNELKTSIDKCHAAFGCDKELLIKLVKSHLNEGNLDRYNRFGKLCDTVDQEVSRRFLNDLTHENIPQFRVMQKVKSILRDFILSGKLNMDI